MKAVYKILNIQDKVTMKHFYRIRCNPDLEKVLCAIQQITFACTGCGKKLSKPWLPNLDKTLQPRYIIKTEIYKYSSF